MAFGLSNKHYSPIAVDFGVDSIKMLQVVASDPPQLVAAGAVVVPEEARQDPAVRQEFLAAALRKLIKEQPFKGHKAICAIPAFQTLVQHLEIARCEPDEFEQLVYQQLRERWNVDPHRMVVRHFPVGQVIRDGDAKQEVVCVAASRDVIMRYVEMARRVKLDVIGMHAEPMAMLRAFSHLFRREADRARAACFIDIGAATTKVAIAHGGDLVFAKVIHAAGDHLTRDYARREKIGFTEARTARIAQTVNGSAVRPAPTPQPVAVGVVAPDQPHGGHGGGLAALDAQVGVPPHADVRPGAPGPTPGDGDTLDCIIDELQLSLRYHQSLYPTRPVDKLVFLGGEAHGIRNCQRIAKALRIGAQLGDPLARVVRLTQSRKPTAVDMRQPQPGWAVPLGLCMSEANL